MITKYDLSDFIFNTIILFHFVFWFQVDVEISMDQGNDVTLEISFGDVSDTSDDDPGFPRTGNTSRDADIVFQTYTSVSSLLVG